MGYETRTGGNGETLYMVGDEWVTENEAREYAQAEADALAAQGDPEAYEGYPVEIAPQPGKPAADITKLTTELPSWTDYTVNVGDGNAKYLERAGAALGLRIMSLAGGEVAMDAEAVRTLARQPEDANGHVTIPDELDDANRIQVWIDGCDYPLEPSYGTGVSAERDREADEALAGLEEGMTYGSGDSAETAPGASAKGYEGMYARLGTGSGGDALRYAHLDTEPGAHAASDLRGWRIRHEAADGTEPAIGECVHRTVVTDHNGTEYLWEQHEHRTDGDGLPMLVGRIGAMLPAV